MALDPVLAAYDSERKTQELADPSYAATWDGTVRRITGPDANAWSNAVIASALTPDDADTAIARQIDYFSGLGHAFEWKLHDYDRPLDLADRLAAAGFAAEPLETLVVFDLAGEFPAAALPTDVEIARLDDPDAFDSIVEARALAHGDRAHAEALVEVLRSEKRAGPDNLSVYAARVGPRVVASAWLRGSPPSPFGSLWGGGTHPDWRRRGIYTALVAVRLDEARRRGFRWVTVDCSAQSLPVLERRGFRRLATTTPWVWTP